MTCKNLFDTLPAMPASEVYETLCTSPQVRIERIVSYGHMTPEGEWYDQDDSEWVMVVQGDAELEYEDGSNVALSTGDYVTIPAHTKHRVSWTRPHAVTIWLAVFYSE